MTQSTPLNATMPQAPSSLIPPPRTFSSGGQRKTSESKARPTGGFKQKGSGKEGKRSRYLGVYRAQSKRLPWTCAVSVGSGVQVTLKATETEEEAARLRDRAFYWLYGEHATKSQMNFPKEKPEELEPQFVTKLEERLVYAGLTRPALVHHDDEEEVVVALEDEDYEPGEAEIDEVMNAAEAEEKAQTQPIELELLESLEQWLAPAPAEGNGNGSKAAGKRSHDSHENGGELMMGGGGAGDSSMLSNATVGMDWFLNGQLGSMLEFGSSLALIAQQPKKKARKGRPRAAAAVVVEEAEGEGEGEGEEEGEVEVSLQQMAAAEEIKCRLVEYVDYMRRAVKEVLPG